MKNQIIYILLIILIFLWYSDICAQNPTLEVGDSAPEIAAFKWIKGIPITTFEKGKVYVVEFGATWCKPCIAAIPHLTALAKTNTEKLNVISFFVMEHTTSSDTMKNPIYVDRVEKFVQKQGDKMGYTVAVDGPRKTMEKNWLNAAGLTGIPQTFIVDKNGFIAWVGVSTRFKVIEEVVDWVMSDDYTLSKAIGYYEKAKENKVTYDHSMPLLINDNGGLDEEDYLFRSIIRKSRIQLKSPNLQYVSSRFWYDNDKEFYYYPRPGLAQWVNMPLIDLYYVAYGDTLPNQVYHRYTDTNEFRDTIAYPYEKRSYGNFWYEPVLEVSDPSPFQPMAWHARKSSKSPLDNKYDYSVQVPKDRASARFIQKVMQRDLKSYFGYEVTVETRDMPCWKLKATKKARKLLKTETPGKKWNVTYPDGLDGKFVFTNATTRDVIWDLGSRFGYQGYDHGNLPIEAQAPFIDATGLTDIQFDFVFHKEHQTDFQAFREYLESLGLVLEKSTRPMKVVVIRDHVQ